MRLIPLASLTIIESILGGTATLIGFISVMMSMKWTKRKKKEFRARIKLIEEYKNKLFYYMQIVKEDGIITVEELNQFDLLLAEFNSMTLELKFKQTKKEISAMTSFPSFSLNERKYKEKEIQKEIFMEIKQEIKEKKNDCALEKKRK